MIRSLASALAVFCLLLTGILSAADDSTWPQWRGPKRDGLSPDTGLMKDWSEKQPKLAWMTEGFGGGYASIAISDNHIFTTGNFSDGQNLICASAADGAILWKTPISDKAPKHGYDGARCTPSIDGDRIYAISSGGGIFCVSANDGKVIWSHDFKEWKGQMMSGWGFSESPLVDGDRVLCTPGGKDAMIVCLNKMTGELIWQSAVPEIGKNGKDGAGYSSIVISNGGGVKQYVQLVGRGVIGVRATDGKYLWGYNGIANSTANIPTPIPFGDYVFTSSGYGDGGTALVKLTSSGDEVKAEEVYYLPANELQNHHGGMLKIGEHVYFGAKHNQGFPICVEAMTGKIIWGGKTRGPGDGSAAVVYADGNIIFRYQNGTVALVEATTEDYKLKGSFKPEFQQKESWAHPVIAGGKLYLREQDKLMCYELKE